ncbi:MAG TPA: GspMb/PilO family protein [Candidatus Saccharimonadales bacterium]|jgi:type IV pilus assembly protein PilO|nr:GspMb/PilO family protein [Candidatus Saccharimonadales bacterium]
MRRDFTLQKRLIVSLLVLLIGADLALGIYTWNLASTQSAQQELGIMMRNRDLLKKDIQRANEIRAHIPAIQKDCDAFEQSLFPETTGYSAVTAELSALAAKSNLRLDSRAFTSKNVKGHDLTELKIEAQVTGDYRGVVRFLNGLQRSDNFYAVDGLSARSATATQGGAKGALQVTVHLKTYFRAA